jgi:hypothetical protein
LKTLNDSDIKKQPVLFAFDQVNALFCKTAYADKESIPITANRFKIVQSLVDVIGKSTCVIAGDCSLSQIKSETFDTLVRNTPKINNDPLDLEVKEIGDAKASIENITGYVVPAFSVKETRPVLEFYQHKNLVNIGIVE